MFPRGDGIRRVKFLRDGRVIDSIGAFWVSAPQSFAPQEDVAVGKKASKKDKYPAPKAKKPVPKKKMPAHRRKASR